MSVFLFFQFVKYYSRLCVQKLSRNKICLVCFMADLQERFFQPPVFFFFGIFTLSIFFYMKELIYNEKSILFQKYFSRLHSSLANNLNIGTQFMQPNNTNPDSVYKLYIIFTIHLQKIVYKTCDIECQINSVGLVSFCVYVEQNKSRHERR